MAYPQLTHDKDNTTMMQMYLAHDANVPKPRGQGKGMVLLHQMYIFGRRLFLLYGTFCDGMFSDGMFSDWDV